MKNKLSIKELGQVIRKMIYDKTYHKFNTKKLQIDVKKYLLNYINNLNIPMLSLSLICDNKINTPKIINNLQFAYLFIAKNKFSEAYAKQFNKNIIFKPDRWE